MSSIQPIAKLPKLFLESKHAHIKAWREEDFLFAWHITGKQYIIAEYVRENWPPFCILTLEILSIKKFVKTLEDINYEVES